MKKILFVSTRPPYPCLGGDKIRMMQLLDSIPLDKYEVDILYLYSPNEEIILTDKYLGKYSKNIVSIKFNKLFSFLNLGYCLLFTNKPLQVFYYYSKKMNRWIEKNIHNYDIVISNNIRSTLYFKDKKNIFKIVDYVDAISMNYKNEITRCSFLKKIIYKIEYRRTLKYELDILDLYDGHIIISDIDKKFILSNYGKENKKGIEVIPNYVENHHQKFENNRNNNLKYILFVGKMDYKPNVDAVLYFSKRFQKEILNVDPSLEFHIVGINPIRRIRKLGEKFENIKVLGYVENLNEYIKNSFIVVAPMISGAGVQNKIIQSMILGKCVITTKIGIEGLGNVVNYKDIIYETESVDIIELLKMCLTNKIDIKYIEENSVNFISNNFSKELVKKQYLKIFNEI